MCQEKREEEDLPASKTALTHPYGDASIQRLEDYIKKHERGLIMAIRNNTDNTIDNRMTITRNQKWEEKPPHKRFKRQINNISHEEKETLRENQNLS